MRTGDPHNPFPEELNWRLTTQLAAVHLAPTDTSKANLLRDGVQERDIVVTGNTVIDALFQIASRNIPIDNPALKAIAGKRSVLITAHRRESRASRWRGLLLQSPALHGCFRMMLSSCRHILIRPSAKYCCRPWLTAPTF